MYSIVFSGVAVSAQQDFFSIKPATDRPIKLHSCYIMNAGIAADAGDAKEQDWGVVIVRGNTTIGSGGTNPTAQPTAAVGDSAFGPTTNVRVNDTTKVSGGTGNTLHSDGFNTRVGWQYRPTPEERIGCSATNGFIAIQLSTTPSEAITMNGVLYVEEEC